MEADRNRGGERPLANGALRSMRRATEVAIRSTKNRVSESLTTAQTSGVSMVWYSRIRSSLGPRCEDEEWLVCPRKPSMRTTSSVAEMKGNSSAATTSTIPATRNPLERRVARIAPAQANRPIANQIELSAVSKCT